MIIIERKIVRGSLSLEHPEGVDTAQEYDAPYPGLARGGHDIPGTLQVGRHYQAVILFRQAEQSRRVDDGVTSSNRGCP
jgi:hypothetical protein